MFAYPVSLSFFRLVPDLLFDSSRVLEHAKIRTVLQSTMVLIDSIVVISAAPQFELHAHSRLLVVNIKSKGSKSFQ